MEESLAAGLQAWRGFNLDGRRADLDETGITIGDNQDKSMKSRKKLAEETKVYKKLEAKEKLKKFPDLLRCYQGEVDSLTKRAKFAEKNFLAIYKVLGEAPDPVPLLENAQQDSAKESRVPILELENKKLRDELSEYQKEVLDLKNQEASIARLEKKIREYDEQVQDMVQTKTAAQENSLREQFAAKEAIIVDREQKMQRQVEQLQEELLTMRASVDSTQQSLFSAKERLAADEASGAHDLDMLLQDNVRLREQVQELEHELEESRNVSRNTRPDSSALAALATLEVDIAQKDADLKATQEALFASEKKMADLRDGYIQEIDNLTELLKQADANLLEMNTRVNSLPSSKEVDELRKEVKVLKAMEFGHLDFGSEAGTMDGWTDNGTLEGLSQAGRSAAGRSTFSSRSTREPVSLEDMLMSKNRHLESLLTKSKRDTRTLEAEVTSLKSDLQAEKLAHEDARVLIARLEDDILGDAQSPKADAADAVLTDVAAGSCGDGAKLTIVMGQRDRFKNKMIELEEAYEKLREEKMELDALARRAEQDNVELLGKIRYLESYDGGQQADGDVEEGELAENRYNKMYEEGLNPFTLFNRKQKSQQYGTLTVHERITLMFSRFLLANKTARTFLFFYTLSIHILLLLVMYKYTHISCAPIMAVAAPGEAEVAAAAFAQQ